MGWNHRSIITFSFVHEHCLLIMHSTTWALYNTEINEIWGVKKHYKWTSLHTGLKCWRWTFPLGSSFSEFDSPCSPVYTFVGTADQTTI